MSDPTLGMLLRRGPERVGATGFLTPAQEILLARMAGGLVTVPAVTQLGTVRRLAREWSVPMGDVAVAVRELGALVTLRRGRIVVKEPRGGATSTIMVRRSAEGALVVGALAQALAPRQAAVVASSIADVRKAAGGRSVFDWWVSEVQFFRALGGPGSSDRGRTVLVNSALQSFVAEVNHLATCVSPEVHAEILAGLRLAIIGGDHEAASQLMRHRQEHATYE